MIKEYKYWYLLVRQPQPTLGSCVIMLKRETEKFSECTPEEFAELGIVIKELEKAMKTAFDHQIMNYLMLMMVDKQVHFHVIPRYDSARTFSGEEWTDKAWPKPPELAAEPCDKEILKAIKNKLSEEIR